VARWCQKVEVTRNPILRGVRGQSGEGRVVQPYHNPVSNEKSGDTIPKIIKSVRSVVQEKGSRDAMNRGNQALAAD